MVMAPEISMELLTDIARALRPIADDVITARHEIVLQTLPPAVVLRVKGATNTAIETQLYSLAEKVKEVTDAALPSLLLEYRVIGGSESAGIEIRVLPEASPVYGHVIKAKLAWLRPSLVLRKVW